MTLETAIVSLLGSFCVDAVLVGLILWIGGVWSARPLLYRVRLFLCRHSGGHEIAKARTGNAEVYEIHHWCTRCGLHGAIKARSIRNSLLQLQQQQRGPGML